MKNILVVNNPKELHHGPGNVYCPMGAFGCYNNGASEKIVCILCYCVHVMLLCACYAIMCMLCYCVHVMLLCI